MCLNTVILWLLLGGIFIGQAVAAAVAEDASCPAGVPSPPSVYLRDKLLCNYDRNARPVHNLSTPTNVTLNLFLRFIYFHEKLDMLKIHTWSMWSWKDEYLKWNKTDYNDMKPTLLIDSDDIWVPDIEIFSVANMAASKPKNNRKCSVKNDGSVRFVGRTVYNARCSADVTRWPFDVQNCTMRMGSWTQKAHEINLTVGPKGINVMQYLPNRDWDLVSTKSWLKTSLLESDTNVTFQTAIFDLVLKRHSGLHSAIVFIPSLVLATLTLVTFWLDPGSKERLFLIYINIVCHCLYLQYLGVTLPSNGDKYPLILLFFRDSLLMVAVSLIITLLVRRVDAASSPPPVWITSLTGNLLATLPDAILLITGLNIKHAAEDCHDGESVATSTGWRRLATLVDRVLFLAFLITLVVLVTAFVP